VTAEVRDPVDARLFQPARPRRAFDEIISQIRGLIDSGQIKPGDRLPSERTLAARFAVSRNTVREALRMLEISNLITLRRGAQGGAFITEHDAWSMAPNLNASLSPTDFSLEDLTDCMRWVCELVVRVVGPRLTDADYADLESNLRAGELLAGREDRQQRAVVLTEFYNVLARASDNPILATLVESLTSIMRGIVPHLETPDHTFVIRSRRRLLAMLREGNVEGAVEELDKYLVRLHTRWLKFAGQQNQPKASTRQADGISPPTSLIDVASAKGTEQV